MVDIHMDDIEDEVNFYLIILAGPITKHRNDRILFYSYMWNILFTYHKGHKILTFLSYLKSKLESVYSKSEINIIVKLFRDRIKATYSKLQVEVIY